MASAWSFLWLSGWFTDLSPTAQRAYLFCAMHPRSSPLGIIFTTPDVVARELGGELDEQLEAMAQLVEMNEIVVAEKHGMMLVRRHVAACEPRWPADVKRWGIELDQVPDCELRKEACIEAARVAMRLPDSKFKACPAIIKRSLKAAQKRERDLDPDLERSLISLERPRARAEQRALTDRKTLTVPSWRTPPPDEQLTDERARWAERYLAEHGAGLGIDVSEQWDRFKDTTFKTARTDVDGTWRNFVRNRVKWDREAQEQQGRRSQRRPIKSKGDLPA